MLLHACKILIECLSMKKTIRYVRNKMGNILFHAGNKKASISVNVASVKIKSTFPIFLLFFLLFLFNLYAYIISALS